MKKYKAIFFDWDGTAVTSRKASAENVIRQMQPLLQSGIALCIISGTNYNNIAGGNLEHMLPAGCLNNLYLGLDRGARNYGFVNGKPVLLQDNTPTHAEKLLIDRAAYAVHEELYDKYNFCTDIVFSRANYCKIDLQVELDRGDNLFLQDGEVEKVNALLDKHGFSGGLPKLLAMAQNNSVTPLKATTDAKFLELGPTTKSDNADFFFNKFAIKRGITADECAFLGDEFAFLAPDIMGSDYFMRTELTKAGDFFDVSVGSRILPNGVISLGGGVPRFEAFLAEQAK